MWFRSVVILIFAITIWGNLEAYTNHEVTVDGKSYRFAGNVIIDTYSLEKDKKGNVRVELNANENAEQVYFYGIDMPEAIRVYKKGR